MVVGIGKGFTKMRPRYLGVESGGVEETGGREWRIS